MGFFLPQKGKSIQRLKNGNSTKRAINQITIVGFEQLESIIEETTDVTTARISRNNGMINSSLIGWCLRANANIAGVIDLVGDVRRRRRRIKGRLFISVLADGNVRTKGVKL